MRLVGVGGLALLVACAPQTGSSTQDLSVEVKHARLMLIRDSAAQMGVYNAALVAGIAMSETGLAHCYSEAPGFSCPGPDSPSCGGPVIAGGADGPCVALQGGLGMFQFDAGTYADTLAAYGPDILTVEGNTAQAVSFVIDKVILDVATATDWMTASDWINHVPLTAGDPVTEQWAKLLACRYNGCCSSNATCSARANGYRDNAISLYTEMGAEFWTTANRCAALPSDGVIDQRSDCYLAGGDPRYWRREPGGVGNNVEWTKTTAAALPSNFGRWIIRTGRATRLHIEVSAAGGASQTARYVIAHAGTTDTVTVDQSIASGLVPLGDFDFAGSGSEYVMLGDNTGESGVKLVFDAIRVFALDGTGPGSDAGGDGPGGGGCAAAGGAVGAIGFVLLAIVSRRRRPPR